MTLSIRWVTSRIWAPAAFIGWRNPSKRTGPMSRAPTATTEQGSWQPPVFSTCWRRCTHMKQREAARHDLIHVNHLEGVGSRRDDRRETQPPAGPVDFRPGGFCGLRLSRTPQSQGAHQVHSLDAFALSPGGRRHRLGYVSVLALREHCPGELRALILGVESSSWRTFFFADGNSFLSRI